MARRYDARTTTFSPDGRLFQVEYATEGINMAGCTIGVLATNGVVLAGEKKTTSKLLDQSKQHEKVFQLNNQLFCAVAGLTSDANVLIQKLRVSAHRHVFTYGESIPVEQLVTSICDTKQGYTQFGGLRPFGVSFLVAGYDDDHGFQLYNTDPSGNYSGWKAYAIGQNNNNAQQMFRQDWNENLNLQESLELAAKVLVKTMDTATPNAEKIEMGVVEMTDKGPKFRLLKEAEINKLMADAAKKLESEKKEGE
jgi:20S proteasome subunit alpha 3